MSLSFAYLGTLGSATTLETNPIYCPSAQGAKVSTRKLSAVGDTLAVRKRICKCTLQWQKQSQSDKKVKMLQSGDTTHLTIFESRLSPPPPHPHPREIKHGGNPDIVGDILVTKILLIWKQFNLNGDWNRAQVTKSQMAIEPKWLKVKWHEEGDLTTLSQVN